MKFSSGKMKIFALVRDRNGNPKFDDWYNIPKEVVHALTDADWEYIADRREEQDKIRR